MKIGTTSKRKKLIQKLDTIVSLIVRARDGKCVICGSTKQLQCSHLIKRGRLSTRFDLDNCNANCNGCNLRHNNYPEFYTEWFLEHKGYELYGKLISQSQQIWKPSNAELESLLEHLTKIYNTYKV